MKLKRFMCVVLASVMVMSSAVPVGASDYSFGDGYSFEGSSGSQQTQESQTSSNNQQQVTNSQGNYNLGEVDSSEGYSFGDKNNNTWDEISDYAISGSLAEEDNATVGYQFRRGVPIMRASSGLSITTQSYQSMTYIQEFFDTFNNNCMPRFENLRAGWHLEDVATVPLGSYLGPGKRICPDWGQPATGNTGWITTAVWDNVGTINGRQVRGKMHITMDQSNDGHEPDFIFGSTYNSYMFGPSFWWGFLITQVVLTRFTYELEYVDTGENIPLSGLYTTIGSLQSYQHYHPGMQESLAAESVAYLYDGQIEAFRLRDRGNNNFTGPEELEITGIRYNTDLDGYIRFYGYQYDFDDQLEGESYLKSCIGFKLKDAKPTLRYGTPSPIAWISFNLAVFGAAAYPPTKSVYNSSYQDINGQTLELGSSFKYAVDVKIPNTPALASSVYRSMYIQDVLDSKVKCTGVKLQKKVGNGGFSDVGSDVYTVNSSGNSSGGGTVKITINSPYSKLDYSGAVTYRMLIDCQILDSGQADNKGTLVINGSAKDTNVVTIYGERKYTITTEVVNGSITAKQENIIKGSDRTISYSPNSDYYLKELYVDGTAVSVASYPSSYTFSNITADHHIKAVYAKNPVITVVKQIDTSRIVYAKGNPIFTFKITGTDYLGNSRTYYRLLSMGNLSWKSFNLKIPAGTYTVTEVGINDYRLSSITANVSCSVSGNSAVLYTLNSDSASCTFINIMSDYSNYTGNDIEVNKLK